MPLKEPIETIAEAEQPIKFILLGEDDADDEELLKEVFTSLDNTYSMRFANNGRKLVSLLSQLSDKNLPCLIILDYNMPELNGADILRELKSHNRYNSIPKIIWSTSGSETYKRLCLELGACEYIIKPSSFKELTDVARHMLSFCSVRQ